MSEMRDPDLTVRTNRRAYVLPCQIAMYIARQFTGGRSRKIGSGFFGRHHTTVLHSIRKIERLRRWDDALDRGNHAINRFLRENIAATAALSTRPWLASG